MAAVAIWSELLGSGMIKAPGIIGAQTEMVIPSNLTEAVFSSLGQVGPDCVCTESGVTVSTSGVMLTVAVGEASFAVVAEAWLVELGAGVSEASSAVEVGVGEEASSCVSAGVGERAAAGVSVRTADVAVAGD